jgi:hypothetical protein
VMTKRTIEIGRGATRGHGHATLKAFEANKVDGLRDRLAALNDLFTGQGKAVFTCTLRSPCIAYDEWLMSRPTVSVADIEEAAGLKAGDLSDYSLKTWFSRLIPISGWNAQAMLPKPDVLAMEAGSAFVFVREIDELRHSREMTRVICRAPHITRYAESRNMRSSTRSALSVDEGFQ